MITDEQGRKWLLQKLYDNGWRYYVKNIGGDVFLTKKEPVMIDNILDIRSGGLTKHVNVMAEIMPNIDEGIMLNIAEELGIIDWSKVPVDTPILVSNDNKGWIKRYFARYEDGNVYCWLNGKTSWTAICELSIGHWDYAKLAEV
jgi:hypothetical protein|nr:MAG TPA: hypothetical protein [Caudoviricetes sp.]